MTLCILDTDVLTLYQTGHDVVTRNVLARSIGDLAVSVISVEEQLGGWYSKLRQAKKADELARVYQRLAMNVESLVCFRIMTLSETAIHRARAFQRSRINVGMKDLSIAAIALEHNATVVTRNLADFRRIPGLLIEDWSQ